MRHSCIFIHGWGGHALGSFKDPNSSYVWIRDNLAKHIPQLRIWTYGYKSTLKDENTVSDVFEWGESLRMDLRAFRKQSQVSAKFRNPIWYLQVFNRQSAQQTNHSDYICSP
jgi:hypothetical protein